MVLLFILQGAFIFKKSGKRLNVNLLMACMISLTALGFCYDLTSGVFHM